MQLGVRGEVRPLGDPDERVERFREPPARRGQRGEDEAAPRALAARGDLVAERLLARHVAGHAEAVDSLKERAALSALTILRLAREAA